MKNIAGIFVCLMLLSTTVLAEIENRTINNRNIGEVILSVPNTWQATERHHPRFGTTFYKLTSTDKKFDVEFIINDLKNMRMITLRDSGLENYVKNNLTSYVLESVEKKVDTHRFGKLKDGVYARLTDAANNDEEFRLLTQGARLFGNGKKVVLFFLKSNDKDNNVLNEILAITESIRLK